MTRAEKKAAFLAQLRGAQTTATNTAIIEQKSEATDLPLNLKQQQAVQWVIGGRSFVLMGEAGTGKTSTVQAIIKTLIKGNRLPMVSFRDPTGGINAQEDKIAVACSSRTNRATNNMLNSCLNKIPEYFGTDEGTGKTFDRGNFITEHKLLEYRPIFYTNSEGKETMRFEPNRGAFNKIPLKLLILEEASMEDVTFNNILVKALPSDIQCIILGDINQLPALMGDSILNVALQKLPVINLTHVYRQALDSPIIRQAHRVIQGLVPETDGKHFTVFKGKDKSMSDERFGSILGRLIMKSLYEQDKYDPMTDMILSPFNKHGAGTVAISDHIATWLDSKYNRKVYQVIAGYCKRYFAVGDRIYDSTKKENGIITAIHPIGSYYGKKPLEASVNLQRDGTYRADHSTLVDELKADTKVDINYDSLNLQAIVDDGVQGSEDRVQQSSHSIVIEYTDTEDEESGIVDGAAGINALELGYSLSCHKAQGCEWERIFIALHDSHFIANREWIYTAITRARTDCTIFSNTKTLTAAVKRQRIKGNTLEEKIASYNEKMSKIKEEDRINSDLIPILLKNNDKISGIV